MLSVGQVVFYHGRGSFLRVKILGPWRSPLPSEQGYLHVQPLSKRQADKLEKEETKLWDQLEMELGDIRSSHEQESSMSTATVQRPNTFGADPRWLSETENGHYEMEKVDRLARAEARRLRQVKMH